MHHFNPFFQKYARDTIDRTKLQRKMERKIYILIIKRQLRFLGHIMRKENLKNLIHTGQIEGKWHKENRCIKYLVSFNKWTAEQGFEKIIEKIYQGLQRQEIGGSHDFLCPKETGHTPHATISYKSSYKKTLYIRMVRRNKNWFSGYYYNGKFQTRFMPVKI